MAMTEEELKEYQKKYRESHKEKLKKYRKEYYKKHKDMFIRKMKKWNIDHEKELKERYKECKFYNAMATNRIVYKYYNRGFAKFISILGYFTIMKTPNESLRRSIMTKLGMGIIDEQEAIHLSGQVLTKEDIDLINSYVNQYKGKLS